MRYDSDKAELFVNFKTDVSVPKRSVNTQKPGKQWKKRLDPVV